MTSKKRSSLSKRFLVHLNGKVFSDITSVEPIFLANYELFLRSALAGNFKKIWQHCLKTSKQECFLILLPTTYLYLLVIIPIKIKHKLCNKIRIFDQVNIEKFQQKLEKIDINLILKKTDPNTLLCMLIYKYTSIFNQCFPLVKKGRLEKARTGLMKI